MEIRHYMFVEGAGKAEGMTVVIDVFRAFSTAAYLYDQGVVRVYAALHPEDAFSFKKSNPEIILVGEREEKKIDGFDFGNSPSEIRRHDMKGKTAVLTTSAGTLGLMHAGNSTERITGSFVNAEAIVRYIQHRNPDIVSLVAMGYNANQPADEDNLCAQYIATLLSDKNPDWITMEQKIRNGTGKRFFDPSNLHSPEADYHLCLQLNRFPFVLVAEPSEPLLYLRKIDT